MKKRYLLITVLAFAACQPAKKQEEKTETKVPTLTKLWETDTVLTTCESVLFDGGTGSIYVSNINGNPLGKDGNGFISKIKKDGSIESLQWAKGLDAPKGMAILNGKLYVTDIDRLVAINLADGAIASIYKVDSAQFLNDVTADGTKVYFSDMATGKIHTLEGETLAVMKSGVAGINGLLSDNGTLLGLTGAGLQNLNQTTIVNDSITGGDGLERVNDSLLVASRWQGEIYLLKGKITYPLLDTKAENSQTADIGFIKGENIVLVPTFFKNKVVAYKLEF